MRPGDEVVFVPSPGERRTAVVAGLLLTGAGVLVAVGFPGGPLGWVTGGPCALLVGWGTVGSLVELFRPKPRLRISAEGLSTRTGHMIAWTDVQDIALGQFDRRPYTYLVPRFAYIGITLADPDSWLRGVGPRAKVDSWLWRRIGGVDVGVFDAGLGLPASSVLQLMEQRRQG